MKTSLKMDRPVLFLDSGIGGIPYCRDFHERNPSESIVYLADRLHFPYGKRDREELAAVLTGLIEQIIKKYNPKMAVLACNTATLAALSHLRSCFPDLPFVGTEPAVKPAVLASKIKKIGVLGTEFTIGEPYIKELAGRFGSCDITGIAAPELVEFVEECLDSASAEKKRSMAQSYIDRFRTAGVDAIVLGCTHFLFLLEEFRQAAQDIMVFESVGGISNRIESLLKKTSLDITTCNKISRQKQIVKKTKAEVPCTNLLLLTGRTAPEDSWIRWANRLGFRLLLLEET